MRALKITLWAVLFGVVSAGFVRAADDVTELKKLEQERCQAISKPDLTALGNLLADDYLHVHTSAATMDKTTYLKSLGNSPRQTYRGNGCHRADLRRRRRDERHAVQQVGQGRHPGDVHHPGVGEEERHVEAGVVPGDHESEAEGRDAVMPATPATLIGYWTQRGSMRALKIGISAVLLVAATAGYVRAADDVAELKKLDLERCKATTEQNIAALDKLLMEDYIHIHTSGVPEQEGLPRGRQDQPARDASRQRRDGARLR